MILQVRCWLYTEETARWVFSELKKEYPNTHFRDRYWKHKTTHVEFDIIMSGDLSDKLLDAVKARIKSCNGGILVP